MLYIKNFKDYGIQTILNKIFILVWIYLITFKLKVKIEFIINLGLLAQAGSAAGF